jgi:hypothetical protein
MELEVKKHKYPNKVHKTRIEFHSNSDKQGRCHFSLHWMADYHPGDPDGEYRWAERAQHFRCDPRTHGFNRPEDVELGGVLWNSK